LEVRRLLKLFAIPAKGRSELFNLKEKAIMLVHSLCSQENSAVAGVFENHESSLIDLFEMTFETITNNHFPIVDDEYDSTFSDDVTTPYLPTEKQVKK